MIEATGEPLVIPEELWPDVARQQAARMEVDPWEDALAPRLMRLMHKNANLDGAFVRAADKNGNPEWRVATDYLLSSVLGLPEERQNNNHTKRLASLMRSLGWSRCEDPMRFGRILKRGFTRMVGETEGEACFSDVTRVTGGTFEPVTPIPYSLDQSSTIDVTPVTPVTGSIIRYAPMKRRA